MHLRALPAVLIAAATGAFVVGVSIERGDKASHHAASGEDGVVAAFQPSHEFGRPKPAGR